MSIEEHPAKDPSQRIGEPVESQFDPMQDLRDHAVYLPALLAAGGAAVAYVDPRFGMATVGSLLLLAFALFTIATRILKRAQGLTTPKDRLSWKGRSWKRDRELPKTLEEIATELPHEVLATYDDGVVETTDGRLCQFIRVPGVPTSGIDADRMHNLASGLTNVVDEDIRDVKFRFFSTSRAVTMQERLDSYQDTLYSGGVGDLPYAREYITQMVDWTLEVDDPSIDSNRFLSYIVLEMTPEDVGYSGEASSSRGLGRESVANLRERIQNIRGDGEEDLLGDVGLPDERHIRRDVHSTLQDKTESVLSGITDALGVDAVRAGPAEALSVVSLYWTGQDRFGGDAAAGESEATMSVDRLTKFPFCGTLDPTSGNAREQMEELAPETYNINDGWIELGDEFVKPLYFRGYPPKPQSMFLREFLTMNDVNIDFCSHGHPMSTGVAKGKLLQLIPDVDAQALQTQEEESDLEASEVGEKAETYADTYKLIGDYEGWGLTSYVVVRADDEDAIETAEEAIDGYNSLRNAKHTALRDKVTSVRKTLEREPADGSLVCPYKYDEGIARIEDIFRSCSPVGSDAYHYNSEHGRTRIVPSGAYGAMFPMYGFYLREDNGIPLGRDTQTGYYLSADPFDRGGAPHMFMAAESGSGKTLLSGRMLLRWLLNDFENRIGIVVDIKGEFKNLVETMGGTEITIGGNTQTNILEISRPPEHILERNDDMNPYQEGVSSIVATLKALIKEQVDADASPDIPHEMLTRVVELTLNLNGIVPDKENNYESLDNESPTMRDLREVLNRIDNEPREIINPRSGDPEFGEHSDMSVENQRKKAITIRDYLNGFQDGRRYEHLLGDGEQEDKIDDDTNLIYLNLRPIKDRSKGEQSAMAFHALRKVTSLVSNTRKEAMALFDEAHSLLYSDAMVKYLQTQIRYWRSYGGSMFFVTQSLKEFIRVGDDREVDPSIIIEQCSMEFLGRMNLTDTNEMTAEEILSTRDLNDAQMAMVRGHSGGGNTRAKPLTQGNSGKGYSEFLVSFNDFPGWSRIEVRQSDYETIVHSHDFKDPAFDQYMEEEYGPIDEMPGVMGGTHA